jgi:alkanesulfonate monooxygenase SsuD/methylene tetrahydromethanopterin reductase-like flavin-dependent oxidoreductase (luciferase family)
VAFKLWDSWDDDAIIGDKAAGIWADDAKVHPISRHGRYFSVEGPLNVPRSPQGYPVLVQAGSSEDGKALAARYAEAVFTRAADTRRRTSLLRRSQRADATARP